MTRWREITFYVDKPESAGTGPDSAGADPDSAGTDPLSAEIVIDSAGTDPESAEIVIEDERAGVLADPLRLRMLEILGEGKTVTEISEALDVPDARVLYHVRRLEETGVVTLKDAADDCRNWRCVPVAPAVRFRVGPGDANQTEVTNLGDAPISSDAAIPADAANSAEAAIPAEAANSADAAIPADAPVPAEAPIPAEAAIPADVAGQFNQAFREAAEGMYGPSFQASVNHNRARLSEAQAAEFNRRLLALIEEYFPPGKGDRSGIKYGFHGVLTPIDLHPLGDTD